MAAHVEFSLVGDLRHIWLQDHEFDAVKAFFCWDHKSNSPNVLIPQSATYEKRVESKMIYLRINLFRRRTIEIKTSGSSVVFEPF